MFLSSARWVRYKEMIQEEATAADNSIKTKRKLMKHRHKVGSSAQSPSLSDWQRGKAANDYSNTPSPQLYEDTTVVPARCRGSLMGDGE